MEIDEALGLVSKTLGSATYSTMKVRFPREVDLRDMGGLATQAKLVLETSGEATLMFISAVPANYVKVKEILNED